LAVLGQVDPDYQSMLRYEIANLAAPFLSKLGRMGSCDDAVIRMMGEIPRRDRIEA
jgi:hypothetical protein